MITDADPYIPIIAESFRLIKYSFLLISKSFIVLYELYYSRQIGLFGDDAFFRQNSRSQTFEFKDE